MIGWAGIRGAAVALVSLLLAILLHPIFVKIRRRTNKSCSGKLEVLCDRDNAKFEIVAVHGLGSDPDHTWTQRVHVNSADKAHEPRAAEHGPSRYPGKVHLLEDLLQPDFPQARILRFAYNSNWLVDAPIKTIEETGKSLLEEIQTKRSHRRLPIIFIGHSLGGVVIKRALCRNGSKDIVNNTAGIIFLGTPHQGSSISVAGAILAFMTGFLGSDTTLLLSLKRHESQLTNLAERFQSCIASNERRQEKIGIISFYETKPTLLLGWLSVGLVVSRNSAVVHADPNESHSIDTDHSRLNKCTGAADDAHYEKLKEAVGRLRAPSLLEQADTYICNYNYTLKRLQIERLSGDRLPMDQCYINLAIVEQYGQDTDQSKEQDTASSPFSLLARQKVETPDTATQVELATIFNDRKRHDDREIQPRRILIRGRAGVGKTTLCKKMVHDFTRGTQTELHRSWTGLFDRLLWVPLRNLEGRSAAGYNYEDLFYHEFFSILGQDDGCRLAKELCRELRDTNSSRTLFVLDGLDEISEVLERDDYISRFIQRLLDQPNVIITSRPNAKLPADLRSPDLELETMGFYPDQVTAYLQADPKIEPSADEIQSFIRKHWLIQGLVRIPIQLDALCYTWEDFDPGTVPDTMTRVYKAIEEKLWKKDAVRLDRVSKAYAIYAYPVEIKATVWSEIELLEWLAFNGLHCNIIDFTPSHRKEIAKRLPLQSESPRLPLDETLARISFLRSSDPSPKFKDQNYHFIHLTFQEYFAARYFVRLWKEYGRCLQFIAFGGRGTQIKPIPAAKFLQKHKYNARYDIFWRFVAGLLDAESGAERNRFFRMIEEEPRDLLGPTHQRLVMHCLSEVQQNKESNFTPLQAELEDQLSQWVLLECKYTGNSQLVREMELSPQILDRVLRQTSEDEASRIILLKSLRRRPIIPVASANLAASWLGDNVSQDVTLAILGMFCCQSALPELSNNILQAITARLDDEAWAVRSVAVEALGGQSKLSSKFLQAVIARLDDKSWNVRRAAAKALECQSKLSDKVLQAIVAQLDKKDRNTRQAAAKALGWQSKLPDKILQAIVTLLDHKDENIRQTAVKTLGYQSKLSHQVVQEIAARLDDEHEKIRWTAVKALGHQSKPSNEILQAIAARRNDKNFKVKQTVVEVLGCQPKLSDEILQAIVAWLDDKPWSFRAMVVDALRHQLKYSDKTLQAIATWLDNKDRGIRRVAVEVLGYQPKLSDDILQAIAAHLNDEFWAVRRMTVKALGRQPKLTDDILQAIAARLDDENWSVKQTVVEVLGRQPKLSNETLQAIVAWLDDENWSMRQTEAGHQREHPEEALQAIAAHLNDGCWDVRRTKVLQAITARLDNKNWNIRQMAVEALGRQPKLPDDILQAIAARLDDENWSVRQTAVRALIYLPSLPYKILELHLGSLYSVLLEAGFHEHLYWLITDGDSYLAMGLREVRWEGWPDHARSIVEEKQQELGALPRCPSTS